MKIETASVDSVILYFEETISEDVLDKVQHAFHKLKTLPHIINLTPSYHSILIQYDIFKYDIDAVKQKIQEAILNTPLSSSGTEGKLIEILVDYSKGLDLDRVAKIHGLSPKQVIAKHTGKTYRVYAIGFMVGFAYLASVDDSIATPRLDSPRSKVPQGSVAIAESQTAIYPQQSAGGWNIIGHTEFDDYEQFEIGDSVRFVCATSTLYTYHYV
ncbi:MAG: allophanate hydrolase [Epsilonproteobacteria bacterium]|nr:MAG: allophanate hydrolase [Campylobacterota bacterium]